MLKQEEDSDSDGPLKFENNEQKQLLCQKKMNFHIKKFLKFRKLFRDAKQALFIEEPKIPDNDEK